jgi:DNA-binding response OmpR family regulator
MPGIMVVEDDAPFRAALLDMLAEAGYTATGFPGGREALAGLAAVRPALVILDLVMPGMDGADFLTRLRATPEGAALPVLILSGIGEALLASVNPLAARDEGILGVVAKPVRFEDLIARVEDIVGPPG